MIRIRLWILKRLVRALGYVAIPVDDWRAACEAQHDLITYATHSGSINGHVGRHAKRRVCHGLSLSLERLTSPHRLTGLVILAAMLPLTACGYDGPRPIGATVVSNIQEADSARVTVTLRLSRNPVAGEVLRYPWTAAPTGPWPGTRPTYADTSDALSWSFSVPKTFNLEPWQITVRALRVSPDPGTSDPLSATFNVPPVVLPPVPGIDSLGVEVAWLVRTRHAYDDGFGVTAYGASGATYPCETRWTYTGDPCRPPGSDAWPVCRRDGEHMTILASADVTCGIPARLDVPGAGVWIDSGDCAGLERLDSAHEMGSYPDGQTYRYLTQAAVDSCEALYPGRSI